MARFTVSLANGERYTVEAQHVFEAVAKAEEIDATLNDSAAYGAREFTSTDNREQRLRDGFALAGGR